MFNAEELALLYAMARTLAEDRDYGELLTTLLDKTIEQLGAERGFVLVYLENRDFVRKFSASQRTLLDEICALASPRLRVAITVESAKRRARELERSIGEADGLLTADAVMAAVLGTIRQVAPTDL